MREVAVPVGVAVAIGAAVAYLVPPHWRAAGLPYFVGYGKNVEHAAVTAALLAGVTSVWLQGSKRGRGIASALAAIGFVVLALRADLPALLAAGPQLVLVVLLIVALREGRKPLSPVDAATAAPPRETDVSVGLVLVLLCGLTIAAFVLTLQPLGIDVYHHGEVLASAVDLLQGGRPFESFLWPHGFHDTGLTALWISATGKIGTSPVALAQATWRALGVLTTFALTWRLLGSRVPALAACAALVLAVVLERRGQDGAVFTLEQLGILVFVVLGFVTLLAPRAHAELPAGAFFGLAYLFRLEPGVYGALAAVAVLARRDLVDRRTSPAQALRLFGASVGRLLLGIALPLVLLRLWLGWPGLAWFAYTLRDLPTYHRDAAGMAFPWPLRGTGYLAPSALVGVGLGRLVLVLLLLIRALGGERRPDPAGPEDGSVPTRPLLFIALFAALAVRSALDRSDAIHLLQWGALPVLGVVLLVVAGLRDRHGWSPSRTCLVLVFALGALDLRRLTLTLPNGDGLRELASNPRRPWTLLLEHLRPNPPVGECADRFFTPTEARQEAGRRFIEANCDVEALLRAHQVTGLVIAHSAPWYYVRFGLRPPTRYFAFVRAYTPEPQRELIADLRARRPEALLRVRGFGGLEQFDIPDAVRVPIVDAYLRERRRGVTPRATPIGDLYFWNEPPGELPAPSSHEDSAVPDVGIAVEQASYQPMSGLLFAEGWAANVSRPEPLRALTPEAEQRLPSLEYGRPRPDLVPYCGSEGSPPCGFEYAAQIAPEVFDAVRQRGFIGLRAVMADGGVAPTEMSLSGVRVLGDLSGNEWSDLRGAVKDAAALGAADRKLAQGRVATSP